MKTLQFFFLFFVGTDGLIKSVTCYRACEQGNVDVVRELLRQDVDGRTHPVTQYSPLYIACFRGHVEIVRILLEVRREKGGVLCRPAQLGFRGISYASLHTTNDWLASGAA